MFDKIFKDKRILIGIMVVILLGVFGYWGYTMKIARDAVDAESDSDSEESEKPQQKESYTDNGMVSNEPAYKQNKIGGSDVVAAPSQSSVAPYEPGVPVDTNVPSPSANPTTVEGMEPMETYHNF